MCEKKGSIIGWVLLGTHPDDDNYDKIQSFMILDFVVDLISDTQQTVGVQVVRLENDNWGKEGNGEDTGDVVIGGGTYMV